MKTAKNRVIHFELQADDIGRAKSFYEKTFGWEIGQMMSKEEGGMDYWSLTTGQDGTPGINGGMYQRPKDQPLNTYDCTVVVDDIDEAVELIKKNGGKIRRDKMEIADVGWFAGATDTEGNFFNVMQATGWQPH